MKIRYASAGNYFINNTDTSIIKKKTTKQTKTSKNK